MQWSGDDPDYWNAGFYPVEVVDKDEYYKVLLKSGDQIVGVRIDAEMASGIRKTVSSVEGVYGVYDLLLHIQYFI